MYAYITDAYGRGSRLRQSKCHVQMELCAFMSRIKIAADQTSAHHFINMFDLPLCTATFYSVSQVFPVQHLAAPQLDRDGWVKPGLVFSGTITITSI